MRYYTAAGWHLGDVMMSIHFIIVAVFDVVLTTYCR